MNKAQRLFKKYRFYNVPKNNSSKEYKEFYQSKKELADYLIILAHQGRLFTKTANGEIENINLEIK